MSYPIDDTFSYLTGLTPDGLFDPSQLGDAQDWDPSNFDEDIIFNPGEVDDSNVQTFDRLSPSYIPPYLLSPPPTSSAVPSLYQDGIESVLSYTSSVFDAVYDTSASASDPPPILFQAGVESCASLGYDDLAHEYKLDGYAGEEVASTLSPLNLEFVNPLDTNEMACDAYDGGHPIQVGRALTTHRAQRIADCAHPYLRPIAPALAAYAMVECQSTSTTIFEDMDQDSMASSPYSEDLSSQMYADPSTVYDTQQAAQIKGERRHACPFPGCGKRFDRRTNMKAHEETHNPNRPKPFVCDIKGCSSAFTRKNDLKRHRESNKHRSDVGQSQSHHARSQVSYEHEIYALA